MLTQDRFDSLLIRRFRGLKEVVLPKLGAFNIFLGANDVGKTSLLEAVFLLTNPSREQLVIDIQNHRNFIMDSFQDLSYLFHRLDAAEPIEIRTTMNDAGGWRHLRLAVPQTQSAMNMQPQNIGGSQNEKDQKEVSVFGLTSSAPSAPRTLKYDSKVYDPQSSVKCSRESTITINSQHDIGFNINADINSRDGVIPATIIHVGERYSAAIISDILIRKKERKLIKELKYFNDGISNIAMKGDTAYIDIGLSTMIPLNMFGGGFVRAAIVFSHCIARNDKILLIDEIETGLYHRAMAPYLTALLKLSVGDGPQIFATSHSLEILKCLRDILNEDEHENMRKGILCHVLAKNKDGEVVAYTYDYEQFDHCIQHGIEIR